MSDRAEPNLNAVRLRQATYEYLSKREKGESLSVDRFCQTHADLMPDLADLIQSGLKRLRFVEEIKRADPVAELTNAQLPVIRGYHIQSEISQGGQGAVFKATRESTGRPVAIKVIDSITSRQFHRFEREVATLAKLNHPGIVSVIDRGRTASGSLYLVMEFVDGENLDGWVERTRTQPDAKRAIVRIFVEIAEALQVAHDASIIHRDLKPSNIRVASGGHPRIIDFGLAQQVGTNGIALTITGNIIGSIPWASPEQVSGAVRDVGPASDIYALGVMVYHAVVGEFPYPVDGPLHEVTRHICQTQAKRPRKTKATSEIAVDDGFWSIIERCLSKDPSSRFASAKELAGALSAYLDGRWITKPRRWGKRSRLAYAGAAATLALFGWFSLSAINGEIETLLIELPTQTNSLAIRFLKIPKGTFTMGSHPSERGHTEIEEQHPIKVTTPFFIADTEVTRKHFRQVMGYLPKNATGASDNCPVDQVTWAEANEFCEKLGKAEGRTYRLPTEAEWEYACRAGTQTMYAGRNKLDLIAWYADNSGGQLRPVATRQPNNWGLYDMEGNAAEWVADAYTDYPGDRDDTAQVRLGNDSLRVVRGGSVDSPAIDCRSAMRAIQPFGLAQKNLGFRIVMSTAPKGP